MSSREARTRLHTVPHTAELTAPDISARHRETLREISTHPLVRLAMIGSMPQAQEPNLEEARRQAACGTTTLAQVVHR